MNVKSLFTFHYVSINSVLTSNRPLSGSVFTFHYVSINSKRRKQAPPGLTYLHSTMYLLIQIIQLLYSPVFIHLHSTMYLLIQIFSAASY